MSITHTNFTTSRNGYDPQEVDAVIIELQRQIMDLKQQNGTLSNTITQYNNKIRQLSENIKSLEEERTKESLRLTGFLNQAAQIAEQTKLDAQKKAKEIIENARREAAGIIENARRETARLFNSARQETESIIENANQDAEKIRGQAQLDFVTAQTALKKLSENTQAVRQSNERYITEVNARLVDIDNIIHNTKKAPSAYTTAPSSPDPAAPQIPPPSVYTSPAIPAADSDPYADFVKQLQSAGQQPDPHGGSSGNIDTL
ncbi:MAG: DivIVA domain-containing protein [Oscillospiraceae bacterium]|nr:DivIVA domain-containing protein [Oscillospiraceae bacterium]